MNGPDDMDPALLELARHAGTVTVLTGAGMSAESGVPTTSSERAGSARALPLLLAGDPSR